MSIFNAFAEMDRLGIRLMVFPNSVGWSAARARDHDGDVPCHGDFWIDGCMDHLTHAATPEAAILECLAKCRDAT